jgi:heme-degrading monooxygenase HmoA
MDSELLPDLVRDDTVSATVTRWRVGDGRRQRLAADALAEVWHRSGWPDPRLLSYSLFGSVHGTHVLHYRQWSVRDTAPAGERLRQRWRELDRAVPGITRLGGPSYLPYRGSTSRGDGQKPGCYVAVRAHFRRPDARAWIDAVFRAAAERERPVPGILGTHSYLSSDGQDALSLVEWVDEQAHQEHAGQPGAPLSEATRLANGLHRISVERFTLLHHLTP